MHQFCRRCTNVFRTVDLSCTSSSRSEHSRAKSQVKGRSGIANTHNRRPFGLRKLQTSPDLTGVRPYCQQCDGSMCWHGVSLIARNESASRPLTLSWQRWDEWPQFLRMPWRGLHGPAGPPCSALRRTEFLTSLDASSHPIASPTSSRSKRRSL